MNHCRAAAILLLALRQLEAQQPVSCIPPATGVPALSGHPIWWDADGDKLLPEFVNPPGCVGGSCLPAEIVSLRDPRWARAVSNSGFDPAYNGHYGDFRAVFSLDSIYFSWQAPIDDGLNSTSADALWFAIQQKAGKSPIAIRLRPQTTATSQQESYPRPADLTVYYNITVYDYDAARLPQWKPVSPTPSWVGARTRIWTSSPLGPGFTTSWAFQVVVPRSAAGLASGLDFDDVFQMWYTIVVDMMVGVADYQYPDRLVHVQPNGANLPDPSNSSDWGFFSLGIPPAGFACAGDVSLDAVNVGSTNPTVSDIKFTPPGNDPNNRVPNNFTNTLFALPKNERAIGSNDLKANDVRGRFYLANWGTQPNWNDLGSGTDFASVWRDITPPTAPGNVAKIQPTQTAMLVEGIQLPYLLGDCERYDYLPDAYPADCPGRTKRRTHQCMLVELFSDQASLTFLNKSVYRNMDIKPMSRLIEEADVSVVGIAPLPDGRTDRDVYLFVEAINMPARVQGKPRSSLGARKTAQVTRQFVDSGRMRTREPVAPRPTDSAQLDSVMPTYRIHAWRATGDSMNVGSARLPILRPQTSFGYWLDHHGELEGWRHELTGANLVRLGPNLYKIAVPNRGVAVVRTTIEALEPVRSALSLHAGVTVPLTSLKSSYDGGVALNADIERRLSRTFRILALFGLHRFNRASASLDVLHISGSIEAAYPLGPAMVAFEAGGGGYRLSPGYNHPGAHAGSSIRFDLSRHMTLGVSVRWHAVFDGGPNPRFAAVQGSARFLF